ncbi:Leucine-, isoleucine-, valine-, threonine-, and alanine-binding protein [Collimonas arenae]|uniref:Leucine-, isoleucine-, valine-, threonine-, and alanine-binding protein n=1 Tax=Collimonas arenae TaxID=279058 RepID=A0A0A1F8Y1_9BURK|nr:branched-chain amino acid ABC transporter substrate-binding protein [Collimonas arenae]AIY39277.1 Leucine-, isoleucine-, valine-, threonine-, and alanine-binding protein [Collimonas arenae]
MQINAKNTLLAAAMTLTMATAVQAQEQVVKIAHVGPITGPVAHVGKDNENGARMAIDDLNAKHLVIGGKKIKFVLQAEDDGSDPKQATSVAQKLVDAKVAAVIGHLQSGTSIPASKIYFDAGIPQISPSATSAKYTEQGFNTTFRVVANDSQLGAAMGRYAAKVLHAKKVAVIDDRTAYGQGLATEFLKDAKANGVDIVSTQYTNDRATDFSAILTAVKAKQPDLIFFGGIDASAGTMLRQMRQLGITAKFMGGDAICTAALPRLAGEGLLDDQVYCAIAGGVENQAPLDAFKAAYKQKYNADIVQYAPYTYDAVMIIAKAMQEANSVDPKQYLPKLGKIQYTGVTGKIAFDDKGDIKNGTLSIYTFRNGQQVLLSLTK